MNRSYSRFWDYYARCYDGLLGAIPYQRLIAQTLKHIPGAAGSVLDAGCGTGNLLHAVHRSRPGVRLTGVDFSEAMLARARRKLPEAALHSGNLDVPLPFPAGYFDVVTCVNVLYAVRDPDQTLAELRRVLKPGGTLIVSSPAARPQLMAFVREHAAAVGWARTVPLVVRLGVLLVFNLLILQRGRRGQYHFLGKARLQQMLGTEAIEEAYSGQNWFACVGKS